MSEVVAVEMLFDEETAKQVRELSKECDVGLLLQDALDEFRAAYAYSSVKKEGLARPQGWALSSCLLKATVHIVEANKE